MLRTLKISLFLMALAIGTVQAAEPERLWIKARPLSSTEVKQIKVRPKSGSWACMLPPAAWDTDAGPAAPGESSAPPAYRLEYVKKPACALPDALPGQPAGNEKVAKWWTEDGRVLLRAKVRQGGQFVAGPDGRPLYRYFLQELVADPPPDQTYAPETGKTLIDWDQTGDDLTPPGIVSDPEPKKPVCTSAYQLRKQRDATWVCEPNDRLIAIYGLYKSLLGRSASKEEAEHWYAKTKGNLKQVRRGIKDSTEYRMNQLAEEKERRDRAKSKIKAKGKKASAAKQRKVPKIGEPGWQWFMESEQPPAPKVKSKPTAESPTELSLLFKKGKQSTTQVRRYSANLQKGWLEYFVGRVREGNVDFDIIVTSPKRTPGRDAVGLRVELSTGDTTRIIAEGHPLVKSCGRNSVTYLETPAGELRIPQGPKPCDGGKPIATLGPFKVLPRP